MKAVCLIPARGGSKRLPRKNIVDFHGRPIISYTIEAALECKIFEQVVVSTEDDEIANIAQYYGADIAKRKVSLASDTSRIVDVCLDFLETEDQRGCKYDVLGCLLATAPMRTAEHIRNAFDLLCKYDSNFVMAVTTYSKSPLQALRQEKDGTLNPMWPEWINIRSQNRPPVWVDNGSTYLARVNTFRAERTFYGKGLRGYIMPREYSIDIDEPLDLEVARFISDRTLNI